MSTGLSFSVPVASLNAQGTVAISTAAAVTNSPIALGSNDLRVLPTPAAASGSFKMPYDTNSAYVETASSNTANAVPFINSGATAVAFALLTTSNLSGSAGITGGQIASSTVTSSNVNSTVIIAAGTNPFTGDQSFGTHNVTGVVTLSSDTVQASTTNGNLTLQPNGSGTAVKITDAKTLRLGQNSGNPGSIALGDVYYDTAEKAPVVDTDSGTTSNLVHTVFSNTANSSAVSAASITDFSLSYTMPAGSMNVLGRVIEVYADGIYTSGVAQTDVFTLRFDASAATIVSSTITMPTSQTNKAFSVKFLLNTRTTGSSGNFIASVYSQFFGAAGTVTHDFVTNNGVSGNIDLTGARVLHISNTFGGAGNSITIQNMWVKIIA